jgi:purine-binding chemotaxis protein CheW
MNDRIGTHETSGDGRQVIGFAVGGEEYGLELQYVREVIRMREVTWLPKAPSYVRGIINLRGQVIPIIDLRERLGLETSKTTAATRVVVIDVKGSAVGMVVDSADQVFRLPEDHIERPPAALGSVFPKYIAAVGKRQGRLLMLLDVERILKAETLQMLASWGESLR